MPVAECKVEGCSKRAKSAGLCAMHHMRLRRHGDVGVDMKRSDNDAVLRALTAAPSEQCIEWTRGFNHEGYPLLHRDGRTYRVNRVVCEAHQGPPPTPKHHAAHSCGNRACVNPQHIRWATPQENIDDKAKHGTVARGERSGSSILTESQVRSIKQRLLSGDRQTQVALDFDVSKHVVHKIAVGKNWGWVDA